MPDMIGWMVHPLAAFALVLWARTIFSARGRSAAHIGRAAMLIVLLDVLKVEWVVHPAAGMLLGYFGSQAFSKRWPTYWQALVVGLVAAALFMWQGAGWLVFPLFFMGLGWAAGYLRYAGPSAPEPAALGGIPAPVALPAQAGGLPVGGFGSPVPELVPAQGEPKQRAQAAPVPSDPFTALAQDGRLPPEARAQLVALDLRTREALGHLERLGGQGSEGAYLARTIRTEYAPASVQAYLNLPRSQADTAPIEDGKTGRDLLREQLELLLNAAQDVLANTTRAGGQQLLTQGRFLQGKFGKAERDLDV